MAPHIDLNHLRRGTTYRATTPTGHAIGEYLGIETAHGDWAVLLRLTSGVASIAVTRLTSITAAA